MRLINADALIEESESGGWDVDIEELRMILKYVPTIDAMPVVRCKECGHYDTTGYPALNPGTGWCDKMDRGVHDDFYCSYGERKEMEGSI